MLGSLSTLNLGRWRSLALIVAAVSLFLAGCNALDDDKIGFWDILWGMVVFFFWFMFIWIWVTCLMDIFRRDDMSGVSKAIWILVICFFIFFGCLLYMILRPKATAQDVKMMAQADAAQRAASGTTTADELAKLAQLRDAGVITIPEYEDLKKKLLS